MSTLSVHGSKGNDVFKPAVYWLNPLTEIDRFMGVDSRMPRTIRASNRNILKELQINEKTEELENSVRDTCIYIPVARGVIHGH